jgi:hypothetical protein
MQHRRQFFGKKLLEVDNIISQLFAVKTTLDYSGIQEWKLSTVPLMPQCITVGESIC